MIINTNIITDFKIESVNDLYKLKPFMEEGILKVILEKLTLKKLAKALDIDYEYLLELSGNIDYLYDVRIIKKAYVKMNEKRRHELMLLLYDHFSKDFENAKIAVEKELEKEDELIDLS